MRVMNEETALEVLEYNIAYQREHGVSPSFRNIMHALNLGSRAAVYKEIGNGRKNKVYGYWEHSFSAAIKERRNGSSAACG